MNHKEARAYILYSFLIASVIVAAIVHGPRLMAYVSDRSGFDAAKEESEYTTTPITIGKAALHVFIADTPERREVGLSFRKNLGNSQGMFFIFDEPGLHGMWMKNMNFPIDIIWLDENLRVVTIKKDITPATYPEVFGPTAQASFVLETNAGFVDANNIMIGSELILYR